MWKTVFKNFEGIPFKFFKGCLPHILLGPLLSTLSQISNILLKTKLVIITVKLYQSFKKYLGFTLSWMYISTINSTSFLKPNRFFLKLSQHGVLLFFFKKNVHPFSCYRHILKKRSMKQFKLSCRLLNSVFSRKVHFIIRMITYFKFRVLFSSNFVINPVLVS